MPKSHSKESSKSRSRSNSNTHSDSRSSSSRKYATSRSSSSLSSSRSTKHKNIKPSEQHMQLPTTYLEKNEQELESEIFNSQDVEVVEIDSIKMPIDLGGKMIKIFDYNKEKRDKVCQNIINLHVNFLKNTMSSDVKDYDQVIQIPESIVSQLIGYKGRQVNKIMTDTGSQVNVNHPIGNQEYRPVTIKGKSVEIIFNAIKSIMDVVDEMIPTVRDSKKKGASLADLEHNSVSVKFVLPDKMLSFIISKEGNFQKALAQKFSVRINIDNGRKISCQSSDEGICQIKGKLSNVQFAMVFIQRRAHEYTLLRQEHFSDLIKMLIPNNFVTKLIGAKGSMVRDIAKKSMGAQIKILSDRASERELQECIVTIAGSLANRQDASCLILEQIEKFKIGGYDFDQKQDDKEKYLNKRHRSYSNSSNQDYKRNNRSRNKDRYHKESNVKSKNRYYERSRSRDADKCSDHAKENLKYISEDKRNKKRYSEASKSSDSRSNMRKKRKYYKDHSPNRRSSASEHSRSRHRSNSSSKWSKSHKASQEYNNKDNIDDNAVQSEFFVLARDNPHRSQDDQSVQNDMHRNDKISVSRSPEPLKENNTSYNDKNHTDPLKKYNKNNYEMFYSKWHSSLDNYLISNFIVLTKDVYNILNETGELAKITDSSGTNFEITKKMEKIDVDLNENLCLVEMRGTVQSNTEAFCSLQEEIIRIEKNIMNNQKTPENTQFAYKRRLITKQT